MAVAEWVLAPTGEELSLSTATKKVPKENAALHSLCPEKRWASPNPATLPTRRFDALVPARETKLTIHG
jgi:hypothetical protein